MTFRFFPALPRFGQFYFFYISEKVCNKELSGANSFFHLPFATIKLTQKSFCRSIERSIDDLEKSLNYRASRFSSGFRNDATDSIRFYCPLSISLSLFKECVLDSKFKMDTKALRWLLGNRRNGNSAHTKAGDYCIGGDESKKVVLSTLVSASDESRVFFFSL